MPPCSGQSRPSPAGGREDAASIDRPCARRLRELAVGMEEYSRRGSNQRMRPKRAKKPTISNRWFSGNFRPALTTANDRRRNPALATAPWLRTIPDNAAFVRPRVYGGDDATLVTVIAVFGAHVTCR